METLLLGSPHKFQAPSARWTDKAEKYEHASVYLISPSAGPHARTGRLWIRGGMKLVPSSLRYRQDLPCRTARKEMGLYVGQEGVP